MKLGFLLFDYFPFGGLQRDCLKIASLCAARGHDVTIFTRTWQGERPEKIFVELFGRRGFSNVGRNRNWLKQLAETLPQKNLDGVIGFNKLPGLDVYYGSDPCYVAKIQRLKPAWHRWLSRHRHFAGLERDVFQRASKTQILLLTSHEIPAYEKFYGTETERFHVLPPGIAHRPFSGHARTHARERIRRENNWLASENLLLLVGSGFRVKGLDRAINALAALPPALRNQTRLVVIGQNRAEQFSFLAKRLGVGERVHFLGGRDDVFDWLLAADLLLHPAYSESAGMILLEAMTAGLPVLTTDVCGYAFHITKAKAGIVAPSPFNQEFLNSTLAEMLVSPHLTAWCTNGLAYAATKDLYSCHERAAEIIEETIANKINNRRLKFGFVPEQHVDFAFLLANPSSLLELDSNLQKHLPTQSAFGWVMNCNGIEHRHVKNRRTVEVEIGGRRYFAKIHQGCGWRELFKDLFQLRPPIVSARNEWEAIERLQKLGVRTFKIAGKGLRGKNPARRESFIVTEAMEGMINLEKFPGSFGVSGRQQILLKRALLEKVVHIARVMHKNGLNHRDFYLCHFLVKDRDWKNWKPADELELVLIDLHRAQIRPRVPERWLVKDLGGILFSAMDCGLTRQDLFRFVKIYRARLLRKTIPAEKNFWAKVLRNAEKLYRDFHKKNPPKF